MKTVLTIAGSDSGGGAGIQADLKTMTAFGIYGTSAVTALTAQNTTGIQSVLPVSPEFLAAQLDSVFSDLPPDAVKIGMVPTPESMRILIDRLRFYRASHIVIDPVMISSSGTPLMSSEAIQLAKEELFPLAQVITPNLPETEFLSGMQIDSDAAREQAATAISMAYGCAVLVKGGHSLGADDLLCAGDTFLWYRGERIENPNTHGTGCTCSSALACGLALGRTLPDAVLGAKAYMNGAIRSGLNLGSGSGPLDHTWCLTPFSP
ncbi:MAG: bifunctional hydroxymethylpyrimidine kinase/phosphomethylpyrimidine kinase [Fusicatenibacter sp.]